MASAEKKPRKGILKNSSSFDQNEPHHSRSKEMKWDEMNILATHHPPDKDYGHMKIDEPPTPYSKSDPEDDDDDESMSERRNSVGDKASLDPSSLSSKLENIEHVRVRRVSTEEEESSEDEEDLTPEQLEHKKKFEQKRKLHYNEFQAVLLAKQLMAEEDDDAEDDDDESNGNAKGGDNNSQDSVQMQTDTVSTENSGGKGSANVTSPGGNVQDQPTRVETTMDAAGHLETAIN